MMRPPPGGTFPHRVRCSAPQKESTASALRGRIGGIAPSGASGGGAPAPAGGGGAPPSPMAITALRQGGDKAAALACRQRKPAEPPGFTPGQCTPKSERQAARTAAACGDAALPRSSARVVGAGGAAGSAAAAGGSAAAGAGGTAAVAGGGGGAAAAGGAGAAAAGVGAGFAGAAAGAALSVGRGPTASSAVLHAGDTWAALRLRHSSASLVPGLPPVHCAMKSERQEARIAEICSGVGCWAAAASEVPTASPVASNTRTARQQPNVTQSLPRCRRHVAQSGRRRRGCGVLP